MYGNALETNICTNILEDSLLHGERIINKWEVFGVRVFF